MFVIIVSTAALAESSKALVVPPAVTGESYVVRLANGSPPSLCVLKGDCAIDGTSLVLQTPFILSHGELSVTSIPLGKITW